MAQDTPDPLTDAEIEEFREAIDEEQEDIRDALKAEGVDVDAWCEQDARTGDGE